MSVAKTAAAIGLNITANPSQANKALAGLNQSLGGTQAKAEGLAAELRDMSVNGLERMTFGMGRAAVSTAKWGVGLGALSATAAAVGLVDMAKDFATGAATMGRSADMMGIPVTRLSQFSIAAHLAGSSAEAMQAGLMGLQNTVSDAAFGGNSDALSAFKAIGIDPGDAHRGAAKDYLAMLPKIADETEKLARTNVRAAEHYLDLTGVGRNLFPVMRHGAAGLQGYLDDAKKNYHLINDGDVDKGRALEKVLAGISEQFTSFAQIGGTAIAPGLTAFFGEFGKFLGSHQADVTAFFGDVEHGIEWLTTPKNLTWLHEEADKIVDGFKEIAHFAGELEHSPLLRRLLGLPVDQASVQQDHSSLGDVPIGGYGANMRTLVGPGVPTSEDDPAGIAAAGINTPTLGARLWNYMFGGSKLEGAVSGSTQQGMAELVKMGWQPGDAAGIIGNLQQESGLNPQAGIGTAHVGIAQWDATRQREIAGHFGKRVEDMNRAEQMMAVNWELTQGRYKEVGAQLRSGSHEAGHAAAIVDRYYESPANPGSLELLKEDAKRAANARRAMQGYDPGAQKLAQDTAATEQVTPSQVMPKASDAGDRMARLKVEIHHINPPAGSRVKTTTDSPGYIDIDPPRVMGAMPASGPQRNVAREGY